MVGYLEVGMSGLLVCKFFVLAGFGVGKEIGLGEYGGFSEGD